MALIYMIHEGTLDIILMKILNRLSHSDAFTNALFEKLHRHRALSRDPSGPMSRTTETRLKTEWKRWMTSSSIQYHQRQNHHLRRPIIVQQHGAVLAAITKRKRGNLLLSAMAGNWRRRSPPMHLSPFQRKRPSTLHLRTTQNPNGLIVTIDVGIVPNEMAMTYRSFTQWTLVSQELPNTNRINYTINCHSVIISSPGTSTRCQNVWWHRWKHMLLSSLNRFLSLPCSVISS